MGKISEYGALAGSSLQPGDLFPVVDTSDFSMAGSGTTKKITAGNLLATTTVTAGGTGAPAPGSTETWTVASSDGFPVPSAGNPFYAGDPVLSSEMVAVTDVSGVTWTVIRGALASVPVAHAAGFTVRQVVSAGAFTGVPLAVNATQGIFSPMSFGAAGDGVTDDDVPVHACFAAAQAASGIVDLGNRGFRTSTPISMYSGMHVRGSNIDGPNSSSGAGGSIINSVSSLFTMYKNTHDITFEHCFLYASGKGVTGAVSPSGTGTVSLSSAQAASSASVSFTASVGYPSPTTATGTATLTGVAGGPYTFPVPAGTAYLVLFNNQAYAPAPGQAPMLSITGAGSINGGSVTIAPVTGHVWDITRRADTGCTTSNGSATVYDPSAVSTDVGAPISGTNIQASTVISSYITPGDAGPGYVLSKPATDSAAGTATFTLGGNVGLSKFRICGVQAQQDNPAHSVWSEFGGTAIDLVVYGECRIYGSALATNSAWNSLQVGVTSCSWQDLDTGYFGNNNFVPFFNFDMQNAAGYAQDMLFRNIVVELAPAGLINIAAGFSVTIEHVRGWDASSWTGNAFQFTKSTAGTPCRNIIVRQSGQLTHNLGAGVYFHVYADSSTTGLLLDTVGNWGLQPLLNVPLQQTTIINCGTGPNFQEVASAQAFAAAGLVAASGGSMITGAGAGSRFVGATVSGKPTSGTYLAGDFVIDQTGFIWICTTGGTGTLATWAQAGQSLPDYAPAGLPGATAASRYAGATAGGAPRSGTYLAGDFVIDQTGLIWICTTAGTGGGTSAWAQVGPSSGYASANDPLQNGFNSNFSSVMSWTSASPISFMAAAYTRLKSAGYSSANIVIESVAVSYGNISVAYYKNSGSGLNAKPNGGMYLNATSGNIPCPAAGQPVIPLGASCIPQLADWLAISFDNQTISVSAFSGGNNIMTGLVWCANGSGSLGCTAQASPSQNIILCPSAAVANIGRGIIAATARSDTSCTVPSTGAITDAAVLATDVGATVFNKTTPANFTPGTVIDTVTPGSPSTFTTSPAQATGQASAAQNLLIGPCGPNPARSCPACTFSTSTATVTGVPSAVAADVGAVVTDATTPGNITAGTIIIAVQAGTGYTLSQNPAGNSAGTDTLLVGVQVIPPRTTITNAVANTSYTISSPVTYATGGLTVTTGGHPLLSPPALVSTGAYCQAVMYGIT